MQTLADGRRIALWPVVTWSTASSAQTPGRSSPPIATLFDRPAIPFSTGVRPRAVLRYGGRP